VHFVGLFFSSVMKMHGPKTKTKRIGLLGPHLHLRKTMHWEQIASWVILLLCAAFLLCGRNFLDKKLNIFYIMLLIVIGHEHVACGSPVQREYYFL